MLLKKSKMKSEKAIKKRVKWLEELREKIKANMDTAKPSEMAELREEAECLRSVLAEYKWLLGKE